MSNYNDSDMKGTERREPPSFAPPVILDRLLSSMEQPPPAGLPPKSKILSASHNLPPKAKIPPSIANPRETAPLTPHAAPPPTAPEPPPPPDSPVPEKEAAPPQKRSPLMAGLMLIILLNLALIVFIIFMFRDRVEQQRVEPTQPPVTLRTEPPPTVPLAPVTVFEKTPTEEAYLVAEPDRKKPTPHIQESDVLHIRKLVLCRSVSGYGHYEPIPDIPLRPHHYPHIQAYVEIAHPKPERRDDGRYVYRMKKTMKVYRSDIGPTEPVMDTALSLVMGGYSPRSDFHSSQALQTSRRIEPGEYVLVVGITDQISGETSAEEMAFLIHDPREKR